MRLDVRQRVEARIKSLREDYGLSKDATANAIVPKSVCTLGELAELLDLIPDDAIQQAVQDEIDNEAYQNRLDFRYAGANT